MTVSAPRQNTTLLMRSPNRELPSQLSAPTSKSITVGRPSLGGLFGSGGDDVADARREWGYNSERIRHVRAKGTVVLTSGAGNERWEKKNKMYVTDK
jgi:hypothetical protein